MAKTTNTRFKYELAEITVNKGNSYLEDAYNTINSIQNHIQCICGYKDEDDEIDGSDSQIYERNYIINLASRLSNKDNTKEFINGEVAKKLHLTYDTPKQNIPDRKYLDKYIEIKRMFKEDYKAKEQIHVFPDFLIHESNSFDDNMSRKTQHIIMEAKTTKITDEKYFWLDFLKLNFYIEKLQFDNAVYLIIGTPLSSINTYIQNYMNKIGVSCGEEIHRLFFIVQEKLQDGPKLYQIRKTIV